jgi:hypothetical protein
MTLHKRKYHDKVKTGLKIPPPRILEQLITGDNMFDDPGNPPLSEEALKREWERGGSYVMSLIGQSVDSDPFCGKIAIPYGCRPWAWWKFDALEPRRLLSGDPAGAMPERGLFFGIPRMYSSMEAYNSMVFETQAAYLERLGFLLPGEAKRIKPEPK